MKILLLILLLIFSSGLVITSYDAYCHGVGSEIFPPVELNGKLVSVEVSSSTKDDVENDDQQISISLIDFDSKITLRDNISKNGILCLKKIIQLQLMEKKF